MLDYSKLMGPDLMAWIMGSADREGISIIRQELLAPKTPGLKVVCELSPAMSLFIRCATGASEALERMRSTIDQDDNEGVAAHDELVVHVRELFSRGCNAQLAIDLSAHGISLDDYYLMLGEGNVVYGFSDYNDYVKFRKKMRSMGREPVPVRDD